MLPTTSVGNLLPGRKKLILFAFLTLAFNLGFLFGLIPVWEPALMIVLLTYLVLENVQDLVLVWPSLNYTTRLLALVFLLVPYGLSFGVFL